MRCSAASSWPPCGGERACGARPNTQDATEFHTLILHWNGNAWSQVASPKVLAGTAGQLSAITVVSATDAWAVGVTGSVGSGKDHTLLLHWNGKAWS